MVGGRGIQAIGQKNTGMYKPEKVGGLVVGHLGEEGPEPNVQPKQYKKYPVEFSFSR
jgi:hypothetical protein